MKPVPLEEFLKEAEEAVKREKDAAKPAEPDPKSKPEPPSTKEGS